MVQQANPARGGCQLLLAGRRAGPAPGVRGAAHSRRGVLRHRRHQGPWQRAAAHAAAAAHLPRPGAPARPRRRPPPPPPPPPAAHTPPPPPPPPTPPPPPPPPHPPPPPPPPPP